MSVMRRLQQRVLALFRRESLDREFDEEARAHIEFAIDDYVARGYAPAEAERIARAKFGLVAASKDGHRDARALGWLDAIIFDALQAVRSLRHARAFSLAAVATLTLALALNVTVFVVMDAVLFRGYPLVNRNDRLLFLQERGPSGQCCLSYLDFEDWRAQARSFEGIAFVRGGPVTLRDGDGRPVDMRASQISANTFSLLGVAPLLGRDFVVADEQPGAAPVIILSHRFWQGHFHGRADVIGLPVHLNERPATIIGVMPERFEFPLKIEGSFWSPVVQDSQLRKRGLPGGGFTAVGRLRDGATADEARAELETINRRLEADYPETNRNIRPTAVSHASMNSGGDAAMIWGSLWLASCFVLIIACANIANLTLVRTIGRWRELATRLALGAGPVRMIRQLVIEGALIGAAAAMLAWGIAIKTVAAWDTVTASQYQVLDYSFTVSSLAYLVIVAFIAIVVIAAAPIVRVLQVGSSEALKGDARGVTGGLLGKRLGGGLVALQMALAIILLSGAGVLVRSFSQIVGAETGVRDPGQVLTGLMRIPSVNYSTPQSRQRYFDRLEAALKAVPGVDRAAIGSSLPVRFAPARAVEVEGIPRDPDDELIGVIRTSEDYFAVLGLAPVSGRAFTGDDRDSSQPVAIVNQAFAQRYWPGQEPIGRRLRPVNPGASEPWRVVVGVVPNVLHNDPLRQTFKPIVYQPLRLEVYGLAAYWLARTSLPPEHVARLVRAAAESVDPDVPVSNFLTLKASFAFDRDFMDAEHSELGKHAKVAPVFAVIALLLSAIGLVAVIAHAVSQRTKEIGIRMAIGATTANIRRLILGEAMWPVAIGVVTGLALSLAANQLLRSQLVGVSPNDPLVLITAPLTLTLVAILASQIPARRAAAVDPVITLRND
jgi:predicted permease